MDGATEQGWKSRPLLAGALRLVVLLVPIACSVAAGALASRVVRRPSGGAGVLAWWVGLTAISTLVLWRVDRVARRLLPLAALLKLSLVFPDRTPSRFNVALRAGNGRHLEGRLAELREQAPDAEPTRAAELVLALVGNLNAHDRRTRGHSERVRALAELLGEELRLAPPERERLRWAALLHDIGKLEVSPAILNKPGKPDPHEWEEIKRHPAAGAALIAPLRFWLGDWADAVTQHHERWDGAGYPAGLAGEQISRSARIVNIADSFEVMTAARSYKRPMDARAARAELAKCAGTQFDPVMVRAFLNISLGRLRLAIGPLSWLAQLPFLGAVPQAGARVVAGGQAAVSGAAATGAAATGVAALTLGGVVAPAATKSPSVRLETYSAENTTAPAVTTKTPADEHVTPAPSTTRLAPSPTTSTVEVEPHGGEQAERVREGRRRSDPQPAVEVEPSNDKTSASSPSQPAPSQPAPSQPAPSQPAPSQRTPVAAEPVPVEPERPTENDTDTDNDNEDRDEDDDDDRDDDEPVKPKPEPEPEPEPQPEPTLIPVPPVLKPPTLPLPPPVDALLEKPAR